MNPMKDTLHFQKISDVVGSIARVCFIVSVGVGHPIWSKFFLLVILLDVAINIYIYREQMSHLRLVAVSSILSLLFLVGVVLGYYRLVLVSFIAFWIVVLVLRAVKKLPLGMRHLIRTHHLISGHNSSRI